MYLPLLLGIARTSGRFLGKRRKGRRFMDCKVVSEGGQEMFEIRRQEVFPTPESGSHLLLFSRWATHQCKRSERAEGYLYGSNVFRYSGKPRAFLDRGVEAMIPKLLLRLQINDLAGVKINWI